MNKQWQVTIWTDKGDKQGHTFYADSFPALRSTLQTWLEETQPTRMIRSTDALYVFSDGTLPASDHTLASSAKPTPLPQGWYKQQFHADAGRSLVPTPLQLSQVIQAFVTYHLIPEKGPEFHETALVNGVLHFPLIKTVMREDNYYKVNEFLKRGWYLLTVDQEGDRSDKSIQSVFILGHPEEEAR